MFIRSERRNSIGDALLKESCHENKTHNLLIKYDRLGGSDPSQHTEGDTPHICRSAARFWSGAADLPFPLLLWLHKYVIY
ncbi:hypothetical protein J6590_061452 [Homalodisca vitripennis]|nr:hypothetical protein J6590_061452 [Homalodisca vitripennis]